MKTTLRLRLGWLLVVLVFTSLSARAQNLNLALGKTTTASSVERNDASLVASNATDGNHATRWSSEFSDPQSLVINLGSTQAIDRVRLTWEAAYGSDFTIDVSNDALNWTTVYKVSGNNPISRNSQYLNEFSNLGARGQYVRMLGTARQTVYGYSIYEFEVFSFSPASASLALGRQGAASNSQDGFPPANAFDGDDATRWSTLATTNQYLFIDLGQIAEISRVYLSWENAYGVDFLLQGSNDAVNWTTFATFTGNQAFYNEQAVAINRRFIRLYGQQGGQNNGGFSLYEFRIFGSLTPLPVSLVNFTAQPKAGSVALRWATASEVNNAGFEVQRSANGTDFTPLAFVTGTGSSATATNYSYLDATPLPAGYYRLRQLDRDGTTTYSPTIAVATAQAATTAPSVYPNPVAGRATLTWQATAAHAGRWYLTNNVGQVVRSEALQGAAGANALPLNLSADVAAGSYLLTIEAAGQPTQRTRVQVGL